MDTLERMTKREFTVLHKAKDIGLLTAGAGTLEFFRGEIAKVSDLASYIVPITRADIDGKDTTIYEDYKLGVIYVYTSYKRQGDGTQINHCTVYMRHPVEEVA